MAIIIDPDNLVLTTDIAVDVAARTIEIKTTGAVSNEGSTGGISGQALYSWLKEQWKSNGTFIKFPFPMEAITPEQFEFINGWKPKDDTTRSLIRNAGWAEKNAASVVNRKYMGVISLGSLGALDQPYYNWNGGSKVDFAFKGPINQAVQIYGDATNGDFDYSNGTATFTTFCREPGKTYTAANNASIGASTLTYQVYRFPLANGVDLKISASDAVIASTSPYTDLTVQTYTTDQLRNIDGTNAPFRIIVTDTSGLASTQQIYEKVQYLLRQSTDIDSGDGVVIGATADALFSFVGDTLKGTTSVAIDNLSSNYLNSVDLYDKNGTKRIYPFVAAGTISFGSQAVPGDTNYWMFYATNPTGDFGSSTAVLVQDKDGNPITGTYNGSPINFSFAYDTNVQGGRTAGAPAAVKVVSIGLSGGQYTLVDATITRTQGQSILLAPAQERNYINPV